jgi:hypothetical protein
MCMFSKNSRLLHLVLHFATDLPATNSTVSRLPEQDDPVHPNTEINPSLTLHWLQRTTNTVNSLAR